MADDNPPLVQSTKAQPEGAEKELPLYYQSGSCFHNAYINKNYHYKDRNLKLVIGSLSFNGWTEYGGKNWKLADFIKNSPGGRSWDAHAWLEDEDGFIYDKVFSSYNTVAKKRTGEELNEELLEGNGLLVEADPDWVEEAGLTYTPADKETQKHILAALMPHLKETERIYKLQNGL